MVRATVLLFLILVKLNCQHLLLEMGSWHFGGISVLVQEAPVAGA